MHCAPFLLTMQIIFASVSYRRVVADLRVKRTCYYLGSGNPKILKDYLIRIGELCGNPDAIKIGARADDGLKYDLEWFDASALIEDTGYMPRISFDQGVLNTINWMKL